MIAQILIFIGALVLLIIVLQTVLSAVSALVQCLCWGAIALAAGSILMRLLRSNRPS